MGAVLRKPKKAKAVDLIVRDFFGFPISLGNIVATNVRMSGGFTQLARRRVVGIDDEGALVCTNMDGKPVQRIKKPKKCFVDPFSRESLRMNPPDTKDTNA